MTPVEAIEKAGSDVTLRVRFSAGVCGDVTLPADIRIRGMKRPSKATPWWKKIFGG